MFILSVVGALNSSNAASGALTPTEQNAGGSIGTQGEQNAMVQLNLTQQLVDLNRKIVALELSNSQKDISELTPKA